MLKVFLEHSEVYSSNDFQLTKEKLAKWLPLILEKKTLSIKDHSYVYRFKAKHKCEIKYWSFFKIAGSSKLFGLFLLSIRSPSK